MMMMIDNDDDDDDDDDDDYDDYDDDVILQWDFGMLRVLRVSICPEIATKCCIVYSINIQGD